MVFRTFLLLLLVVPKYISAQDIRKLNFGGGYFGETLTHAGGLLTSERVTDASHNFKVVHRVEIGFYIHPRNHIGLFLDFHAGVRKSFGKMFIEHAVGIGPMFTIYNGDGIFQIDRNGSVRRASRFASPDFMPSITLGLGRELKDESYVFIRPKIFWQIPYNNLSQYHPSVIAGFTKTIKQY